MKLYMPTKVYNEKGCVRQHSQELAALGTKALLVTGKHSSRVNGSLQDVEDALNREQVSYVIFDGIEENPSVETVMRATALGLSEKVDFVIGIGGGSPMDASKAIALMIANPEKKADFLYETDAVVKQTANKALPVAAVPTTAGTGSEVTPYAILTRVVMPKIELTATTALETSTEVKAGELVKQSISHHIFPELALVDSAYLQTASKTGCINTAVDTLAHLVESHLNTNATPYSRVYSEMGLRTFAKVKDALASYEIGEAQRELLMQACTLGGMAISHTGTSLPHGLSYRVTCELGTPHGKAVGMFLPGFLRCYGDQEEAMRVLTLLGFGSHQSFEAYIYSLIGEEKISRELWERTMNDLLSNPAKLKNYPFQMDREKLNGLR